MEVIIIGLILWGLQALINKFGPSDEDQDWLDSAEWEEKKKPEKGEAQPSYIDKKIAEYKDQQKRKKSPKPERKNLTPKREVLAPTTPLAPSLSNLRSSLEAPKAHSKKASQPSVKKHKAPVDQHQKRVDSLGDKEISSLASRMSRRGHDSVNMTEKKKKKKVAINIRQAMLHKIILEKPKALQ